MTKRKDTKAKAFTCRGAAALITAALLTAAVLFTGCPQSVENQTQNPSVQPAEQKVTLTVAKGEHVQKTEPASLTVDKGSAWSAVKGNITVTYEAGWEAAGWKFDSAAGSDISDTTVFNENKTVVVLAKAQGAPAPEKITITVTGGEHVTVHTANTFTADKGAAWQDIRSGAEALVTYETGWENGGWKFDDAAGIDVNDAAVFNENKTVFASAKPLVNPNLRIEGGVLKGYNETPSGALVVPAGVTEIAPAAFSGCTSLTSLSLPSTLKTIGDSTFYGCTGLSGTVVLPASLTKIGMNAFSECTKISALDFSACTQPLSIGYEAFKKCTGISGTVALPAKLTTIDRGAFSNCNKVTAFDFTQCTQLTEISYEAFGSCKADAVFTVKAGGNIKNLLLNSKSGIKASQITEVP